ncbi:MAG: hypothetical protein HC808_04930 [Candidatus Competibacteraceae bacterium]|nr:hypothetical protein [Candidatus Competibacteraceae bacterium]
MLTIMSGQTTSRSVPNHAFNTALIATPGEEAGVSDWLWPLLAERSQERRWIFWIAPAEWPTLGLLCAHGVDPNRVRLVHLAADSDPLPLVERALRAGTCSAVLAWPATIEQAQWSRIRQAACENQALAVLMPSQTDLSLAA